MMYIHDSMVCLGFIIPLIFEEKQEWFNWEE